MSSSCCCCCSGYTASILFFSKSAKGVINEKGLGHSSNTTPNMDHDHTFRWQPSLTALIERTFPSTTLGWLGSSVGRALRTEKNRRRVAATTTTTRRRHALFVNQSKKLPIFPTIPLQYISGVKSQKWLPLLSYCFLISYLFIVELALILNMYDIFPATNFSLLDVSILYIVKLCGNNKWWNRPKLPFLQIINRSIERASEQASKQYINQSVVDSLNLSPPHPV
jgi:hypothetical protein